MKKKLVAMLLITAVCGTTLAGCGGGGTDNSAKNKSDSQTSAEPKEVDADGKIDGLMYAEGLPIVDEGTYSFSIFCDDSSATGEFYMMDELKKQTNVDVELQLNAYENATEKMNLALNSGSYADVIGGWILTDAMILTYGVEQGVFIPLEDIFEQYCPNISAILDLPGVREKMTAPDGHIYSIPYVCGDTTVNYSPYINSEWLANVNMEMPTTTDELEEVLKAFKAQDANGNGDPNDEIPFSTDPNNKYLEGMTGYFGMPMTKEALTVVDGETAYAGLSKEYRQCLSWLNKLYEQGLIDTEIFTQDSATWEGKGNRDMYGVSIAYGSSEFSGLEQTTEKPKYDPLPVLNADQGGKWMRATLGNSTYRTQAVITDNAEHPEIIARWFDNAFEFENGIGCTVGPVGVVCFKEGEGDQYRRIDTKTLDSEMQEKISWSNLWPQSLPKYTPIGWKPIEDNPLYDEKKAVENYYEPWLTKDVVESIWVDQDSVEIYSEYKTAIDDYFRQQQALFVSGEQDIDDDAAWQAYKDGYEGLGLSKYLEIRGVTKIIE